MFASFCRLSKLNKTYRFYKRFLLVLLSRMITTKLHQFVWCPCPLVLIMHYLPQHIPIVIHRFHRFLFLAGLTIASFLQNCCTNNSLVSSSLLSHLIRMIRSKSISCNHATFFSDAISQVLNLWLLIPILHRSNMNSRIDIKNKKGKN